MYEKMHTQNKKIQIIQNIILTGSTAGLVLATVLFSGLVGGLWQKISVKNGPIDDVEGYAMIVQGAAGILGSLMIAFLIILLIILAGINVFIWVMFVAAYSKKATIKRYCICTGIEAGVKTVLIGSGFISIIAEALKQFFIQGADNSIKVIVQNANIGTMVLLLYLVGSIKVLWNIHTIKRETVCMKEL